MSLRAARSAIQTLANNPDRRNNAPPQFPAKLLALVRSR